VLPALRRQPGYEGVYVLTTPEGRALLMTLWASEEAAEAGSPDGFYSEQLARHATLFRAPPGRERYEVSFAETTAPLLG
jgi:heme-degrading monooxygenase HmoA